MLRLSVSQSFVARPCSRAGSCSGGSGSRCDDERGNEEKEGEKEAKGKQGPRMRPGQGILCRQPIFLVFCWRRQVRGLERKVAQCWRRTNESGKAWKGRKRAKKSADMQTQPGQPKRSLWRRDTGQEPQPLVLGTPSQVPLPPPLVDLLPATAPARFLNRARARSSLFLKSLGNHCLPRPAGPGGPSVFSAPAPVPSDR